ncbi:MAG: GtrA family protein [Alphaproteobacteria bacterium]
MSTGEKTSPASGGSEESRSALRFLIVSAAAFCIDLALALAAHRVLHIPIWLAAGIAYGVVSAAFYFVHEHWTFAREGSRNSAWRMAQTVVTSVVSMGGRIGLIYLLEAWREPGIVGATAYIWLGAMVSLGINYTLSRFWVFAAKK